MMLHDVTCLTARVGTDVHVSSIQLKNRVARATRFLLIVGDMVLRFAEPSRFATYAEAAAKPRTLAARRVMVGSVTFSLSAKSSPNRKRRNELPITKISPAK